MLRGRAMFGFYSISGLFEAYMSGSSTGVVGAPVYEVVR